MNDTIVVVDLETSGLDPCVHCIVEVGACVLDEHLQIASTFHSRVRPSGPIDPLATRVHGLTEDMLKSEPSAAKVLGDFIRWAPEEAVLAGQNVWFDAAFLSRACREAGLPYPFGYHVMDLWTLTSFALPRLGYALPSYDLDAQCRCFGLHREVPHTALSDARASAEVLCRMHALLNDLRGDETERHD